MATVHEDMKTNPQGYLDRIVEFVGAAPVTLQHQHLQRVLTSEAMTQPRSYYWTRGALRLAEWSKARRMDGIVAAAKRIGGLRLFVGGGPAFPEVPVVQRAMLRELFRPEVERLEEMLSRDLSGWK